MEPDKCKICGSPDLALCEHTARCSACEVLLYYPYPDDDDTLVSDGVGKDWNRENVLQWYSASSFFNHSNFTHMLRFTMDESCKGKKLKVLDFGGGGGQFALVCKSHFPEATVYITDISDMSLLDEWKDSNVQIPFAKFDADDTKFDFIFLNDVFEHVSDPAKVLKQLAGKLTPNGQMFIDTPKQFWIYPVTKKLSRSLHKKILKGTVSTAHLQIWSKRAFELVVRESGLSIRKYDEISEYTMPANFYLESMGVRNPLIRFAGRVFYGNAKWLAKNKILSVVAPTPV